MIIIAEYARWATIDEWISTTLTESIVFQPDPQAVSKLEWAFRNVLRQLSEEELGRFMYEVDPTVLHFADPRLCGCIFHLPATNMVYLKPTLGNEGPCYVNCIVAHEIAHLMLGHQALGTSDEKSKRQVEDEADALAATWGFQRSECTQRKECE